MDLANLSPDAVAVIGFDLLFPLTPAALMLLLLPLPMFFG